jgi:two-component system alkaline phosphatase synthesis response regulator PhoP
MKKILIADDEPDIVKVVKFRLIKAGYEVLIAVNGIEALRIVKDQKPDLILLDFSMPLMNGDEVCRNIKANPETKNIPIILITASTKIIEDDHIKTIGINDRVLKPFEPDELLEKIKKLIA